MEENTGFKAEFWSQLRATLIRNILRKKRNKRHIMKVGEEEEIIVSNPSFLTKFNQLIQKTPKKIQVEKNPFNGDFFVYTA